MVEVYDDRISIVSPGGVPKGITSENFGKRSVARNPIIADLLRRTHYIEKAGTGIGRMRELMKEAGLREPDFQYDDFFEVTFSRPSYYDENYGKYDLSNKELSEVNNLTTLREVTENDEAHVKAYDKAQDEAHDDIDKKIIEFCKKEKNIFEIMKYIGYKNRTRFRRDYIKPLVEKGLLKMTIPDKPTSRNQKYISI